MSDHTGENGRGPQRSSAAEQPGGGPGWVELCDVSDLVPAVGRYAVVDGLALAVFLSEDGTVRVLDDACPHAGASLSGGGVTDGCVVCPWHGWPFDLATGRCSDNPAITTRVYAARVTAGRVYAQIG